MPRHRLTLPPSSWPEDLRVRFEQRPLSAAQRTRLGRALGRWFKISSDLAADARDVSRETRLERTQGLSRQVRNEVRQALAITFPNVAASLYAEDNDRVARMDTPGIAARQIGPCSDRQVAQTNSFAVLMVDSSSP